MSQQKQLKLTSGALRAAGAIFAYMLPKDQLDEKVCYYLAEIIDRETGGPKVEEIISLIERLNAHFDSGLYYITETEWNFLHAKAREVEAALGGKAE